MRDGPEPMRVPHLAPYDEKLLMRLRRFNRPVAAHELPVNADALAGIREQTLRGLFLSGRLGVRFGPHYRPKQRHQLIPYYYPLPRPGREARVPHR